MRILITLMFVATVLIIAPSMANADGRDHYYQKSHDDRNYERSRHYVADRRDRVQQHRGEKYWKNRAHRDEKKWKKHRKHRYAAHRRHNSDRIVYSAPVRQVIVRDPFLLMPLRRFAIGTPSVSVHLSW
ncbi:MAG: hypothetical protein C0623_02655 [Desulfuromonas sp.]|nr:MAG: hypothetical protein C0623_02655 [Desulfuromonas sp.]